MDGFKDAVLQLREAMQRAGEPREAIEEAALVLTTYDRVRSSFSKLKPAMLAAATRLALAQRDRRNDLTPGQLAAAHATHPPSVSRLARNITDTLGLDVPPLPPALARRLGLPTTKTGAPLQLPLPQTTSEAYARRRLMETIRDELAEAHPLHEREVPSLDGKSVTYVLRIHLHWEDDVWRELELRGDQTLFDLQRAIQRAFGWDNDHLWAFYMAPVKGRFRVGNAKPGTVYGCSEDDESADVPLARFALRTRRRFRYLFDFGANLLHEIEVRQVGRANAKARYPRALGSQGRAPPQYHLSWED